jgi:predicted ArsR family transcriptional regulator
VARTVEQVRANPDTAGTIAGYASTKQEILVMLKRDGQCDMQQVAKRLGISRMAVQKHAKDLESRGLIERVPVRGGPGRPRLAMRLAPKASNLFPKAYAEVSCSALAFIEEKMGRKGVEEALRRRQTTVMPGYKQHVQADSLEGRVKQLTELRDEEGYMAESREAKKGAFEIIEYNCPIRDIAERYWEACTVENEMFRRVLKADVETTHRVVAGAHACQFLIKPRKE